jgi:hypothetical protein
LNQGSSVSILHLVLNCIIAFHFDLMFYSLEFSPLPIHQIFRAINFFPVEITHVR